MTDTGFFTENLSSRDPELFGAVTAELGRQRDEIELIASENIVSLAVLQAQGSVLTNNTRWPCSASSTAVAQAIEVLPTPPLPVKKRKRGG